MTQSHEAVLGQAAGAVASLRDAIGKVIVGQSAVVDQVMWGLVSGGHVLLEGAPGLGKTLLVRTLAQCLDLKFSRIQFTPDLMPSDIVGTNVLVMDPAQRAAGSMFAVQKGPIFGQIVLADEINRATPKTQAALLEAMAEQQVTVAGTTRELPEPFFVLATLNPIEMEGTYQLPEAQLDRFFFKVVLDYPSESELVDIFARTTAAALPAVTPVLDRETAPARIGRFRQLVRDVLVAPAVERWVASLVRLTVPATTTSDTVRRHVTFGASPRGGQALLLGAKVTALLEGRPHVTPADVERVAHAALGHRLVLAFGAEAAGVDATRVVDEVLAAARAGRP